MALKKLNAFLSVFPRFLWRQNPDAVAFPVRLDEAQNSSKPALNVPARHQRFSGQAGHAHASVKLVKPFARSRSSIRMIFSKLSR